MDGLSVEKSILQLSGYDLSSARICQKVFERSLIPGFSLGSQIADIILFYDCVFFVSFTSF